MSVLERIGATELRSVIERFRDALAEHREGINQLNVYPVPDGDTGTNMALTLESVVAEFSDDMDLAALCKAISHGSLMGARGNSGVILSQILRGLADALAVDDAEVTPASQWAGAFEIAAKAAYTAVLKPVEGTILTVVRELADAAVAAAARGDDLLATIEAAQAEGYASLERTPTLLPVLADAGVVDAGGRGFLLFLDALLAELDGRPLPEPEIVAAPNLAAIDERPDEHGSSIADLRYEVMFLLDAPDNRIDDFKAAWGEVGDSIVVVGGDGIWNCHIHSDDIGASIEAGIAVGRPHKIRVTDLLEELEHLESVEAPAPENGIILHSAKAATCAVVTVGVGDGVRRIFESLGAQAMVLGGQTMNPSTQLLLDAVEQVTADQVVVLPNNKNIVAVAEQVNGQTDKEVRVVPTAGVAEGFASLMAYDPGSSADDNHRNMAAAAAAVVAGEVTQAVRDTDTDAGAVTEGDWLGLSGGSIVAIDPSLVGVTCSLLAAMLDDDHELITLICGVDAARADTDAVAAWVEANHPDVEVEIHLGGQPLYPYYVGIE